ncbi:ATP-grasp domain-containing protein [Streptomyces sp. G44]|uniref:ATP-grasp domain-containing protein n=1 Tax=Streptomyces sp. G44 TaxID=2807632 RepID=UPI0019609916|nr:ATP-grasp domain-containing protein [Streptomyces sp. G44]MBM7172722.1 ATP-grasp domain-containing protein [Streptomyces sp. G44]
MVNATEKQPVSTSPSPHAQRTVVIVDPVSTGAHLAPAFHQQGWRTVAVHSSDPLPPVYAKNFRPEDFTEVVVHHGDVTETTRQVAAFEPRFVVAGAEPGVELTDALAERLGLCGNEAAGSSARRDKYAMVERVRRAGLDHAASLVTADADELVAWAERGGHWPLVVKPVDSVGSDSVTFCSDAAEARQAFARIHGAVNHLGIRNDVVLAQELLTGQQYFVNSVSRAGRHYINEIWKDVRTRVDGALVYDWEELVPGAGTEQEALRNYLTQVLDALGIRNGPAHSEVMFTARGPVLIECGARIQGADDPELHRTATGTSQVDLTVRACVDPVSFDRLPGQVYRFDRRLRVVSLIAPYDGELAPGPALDEVASLPTLVGSVRGLRAGTPVRKTVDLFSSPDHLALLDADPAAVERDYATIRRLEREGLYRPVDEGRTT